MFIIPNLLDNACIFLNRLKISTKFKINLNNIFFKLLNYF